MIEAEWPGTIGITESRRVAAVTLANRVADETGTLVQGDTVGYTIQWDTCPTKTKIKYMTEGILIREMMADPLLSSYSAIMVDEVHERTLYTDILLGLLKKIIRKRKSLRLIIASATMDAEHLQNFFNTNTTKDKSKDTAAILSVEGRQYPVDIFYIKEPIPDYIQATVETVLKIHSQEPAGDILAFLTGLEEVERTVRLLNEHSIQLEHDRKETLLVLPLYGSLPNREQLKVFQSTPKGSRKVVVATNLAETSVTIPGIVYVIDCGFVKLRWFNAETHTDSLVVVPISKASAEQRVGRAGRVRSGKGYRLYTEEEYEKLAHTTPPEMQRTNLTSVVLQLKALGIDNVLRFNFPTPPPAKNLLSALELLYALHAIDDNGAVTEPHGATMAEFALDPLYSKMLLASGEYGCSEEILSIISMLQVENVYIKPASGQGSIKARVQKRNFEVEEGDLITLLNVFNGFMASNMGRDFCQRNYINYKVMKRVLEIRERLKKMMKKYCIPIMSSKGSLEAICKCITAGLFPNAAYLHPTGVYKTVRGDIELHIHPNSVLYTIQQPQWVIFCEILYTSKVYMRDLTVIKEEWLVEVAPHFYHKTSTF